MSEEAKDPHGDVNLKEGYLEKQSRRLKLWQKRFFELIHRSSTGTALLKYYDSDDKVLMRGEIAFSSVKFSVDKLDTLHAFVLQLPHRKYVFRHQDSDEINDWVKKFEKLDHASDLDGKVVSLDQEVHKEYFDPKQNEKNQQAVTDILNTSDISDLSSTDNTLIEEDHKPHWSGAHKAEGSVNLRAEPLARMKESPSSPRIDPDIGNENTTAKMQRAPPPVPLLNSASYEPDKALEYHSSGKSFLFRAATKESPRHYKSFFARKFLQPDEESDDEDSVLLSEKDLLQYLQETDSRESYNDAQKSLPSLSSPRNGDRNDDDACGSVEAYSSEF
mmetsp:Transcript_26504/g.87075  ORF Transcript_26504/g.87075 Transcript_26504/m.87075 type:complete len:332 (-) Transcript_26504:15-1010(-)